MNQNKKPLGEAERFDWLRLIRSENVGPVTFYQLLLRYHSAGEALAALPELARRGGRKKPIRIAEKKRVAEELAATQAAGAKMIASCEPDYPPALAAIADPPPLISVIGHPHLFSRPVVALVGARNASAAAQRFTRDLAGDLGAAGLVVASGMARGLDTAAHLGSLESGTIAVLAGGVDHIYPPQNEDLYHRICESGAVISEMPVGTEPQARHFPRRNRLISGVSLGVVVVEAALRSGTLITARYAAEQGREVFAVPGSPADPRCRGGNKLIKDGAILVEGAEDIIAVIGPMTDRPFTEKDEGAYAGDFRIDEQMVDDARHHIHELLGPTPTEINEIIRLSACPPAVVMTVLLELELAGRLERHPGQRVSLT